MTRKKRRVLLARSPVARKAGQVFRALKGRGSYRRQNLKQQLKRGQEE